MCSSNVSYDCDFFFNDTATTEIYTYCHTLSLHDALPIDTLPVSWSVRPAMMWSSVDLPQPERPSRAAMLPDGTVRSMSRRTSRRSPPRNAKLFDMCSSRSARTEERREWKGCVSTCRDR